MRTVTIREKFLEDLEMTLQSREYPKWMKDLKLKAIRKLPSAEAIENRQLKEIKMLEKWVDVAYTVDAEEELFIDYEKESVEESTIVIINGEIADIIDPRGELKAKNVKVKKISSVDGHERNLVMHLIENILEPNPNIFDVLNISTFNKGYYIEIPDNTVLENPIKIVKIFSDIQPATVAFNVIKVGKNSKASIYEETTTTKQSKYSKNLSLENIVVDNDSKIDYLVSYIPDDTLEAIIHRRINVYSNAEVQSSYAWLGGKFTLSKIDNNLVGPGANVNHVEIVFGSDEESFYLLSKLNHYEKYTKGEILNRGVMKNKSRMVYNGLINIEKNASGADSFLASHVILLDKTAEAYDVPGLEIKTNDVRATHSASVSPIDEDQIFYMRTRGIDRETARKMIVFGTLQPAVEKITVDEIRNHILKKLEEKWGSTPN